jgi:hypothetical protein
MESISAESKIDILKKSIKKHRAELEEKSSSNKEEAEKIEQTKFLWKAVDECISDKKNDGAIKKVCELYIDKNTIDWMFDDGFSLFQTLLIEGMAIDGVRKAELVGSINALTLMTTLMFIPSVARGLKKGENCEDKVALMVKDSLFWMCIGSAISTGGTIANNPIPSIIGETIAALAKCYNAYGSFSDLREEDIKYKKEEKAETHKSSKGFLYNLCRLSSLAHILNMTGQISGSAGSAINISLGIEKMNLQSFANIANNELSIMEYAYNVSHETNELKSKLTNNFDYISEYFSNHNLKKASLSEIEGSSSITPLDYNYNGSDPTIFFNDNQFEVLLPYNKDPLFTSYFELFQKHDYMTFPDLAKDFINQKSEKEGFSGQVTFNEEEKKLEFTTGKDLRSTLSQVGMGFSLVCIATSLMISKCSRDVDRIRNGKEYQSNNFIKLCALSVKNDLFGKAEIESLSKLREDGNCLNLDNIKISFNKSTGKITLEVNDEETSANDKEVTEIITQMLDNKKFKSDFTELMKEKEGGIFCGWNKDNEAIRNSIEAFIEDILKKDSITISVAKQLAGGTHEDSQQQLGQNQQQQVRLNDGGQLSSGSNEIELSMHSQASSNSINKEQESLGRNLLNIFTINPNKSYEEKMNQSPGSKVQDPNHAGHNHSSGKKLIDK